MGLFVVRQVNFIDPKSWKPSPTNLFPEMLNSELVVTSILFKELADLKALKSSALSSSLIMNGLHLPRMFWGRLCTMLGKGGGGIIKFFDSAPNPSSSSIACRYFPRTQSLPQMWLSDPGMEGQSQGKHPQTAACLTLWNKRQNKNRARCSLSHIPQPTCAELTQPFRGYSFPIATSATLLQKHFYFLPGKNRGKKHPPKKQQNSVEEEALFLGSTVLQRIVIRWSLAVSNSSAALISGPTITSNQKKKKTKKINWRKVAHLLARLLASRAIVR